MTTERVEEKVRETLHALALDQVRARGDLVETVVRRRARRRFSRAAGAAVAVAAIAAGAVFGVGSGAAGEEGRPAAAPEGWRPWQSSALGVSDRGCVVDGAALYCSGSEYDVVKLDADTGERLWTVEVNGGGDGVDAPVAVRDGVVYAYRNHTAEKEPNGDYMGGTDLMAVDADDGEVLWAVEMPQDDRTDQAAMLIDGAVLANTPSTRTMSALDPLTGKEKWRHTWDKGVECRRAVLGGVPHLMCRPNVEEPSAAEVFRLDPATGDAEKIATLRGSQELLGASGDRMVLIGSAAGAGRDSQLTTISASGEQTSRPYRIEEDQASWDVVGDRLITVSWQGEATVYSLTSGKTLWTAPVGIEMPGRDTMTGIASPAVSERQGIVYFFGPTGDLSGLDLRTGEQVWRDHVDTGRPGGPGPGIGALQLLRYEDVLVARNSSKTFSLLPRIGD